MQLTRQKTIAALWHLLPLAPLGFGHYYAAMAACLLVAVPYIKSGKLSAIIDDLNEKFPAPRASAAEAEVQRLESKLRRWQYLTLFKP